MHAIALNEVMQHLTHRGAWLRYCALVRRASAMDFGRAKPEGISQMILEAAEAGTNLGVFNSGAQAPVSKSCA